MSKPLPVNAAVFEDPKTFPLLPDVLARLPGEAGRLIVVSDDTHFLRLAPVALRLSWLEVGLDREQIDGRELLEVLRHWLKRSKQQHDLIVDMSWVVKQVQAQTGIETWGVLAEQVAKEFSMVVISRYHRELLTQDQAHAALEAHRQLLAPSGLHENPYWMPAQLRNAPKGEQLSWVLGRVAPDYEGLRFFERDDQFAARGASPNWLARSRVSPLSRGSGEPWKIYCFGQLRVYRAQGERIDWKIKGGAPKKTRTLFAYLLSQGEKGVQADRIAELLWSDTGDEATQRARLHHTVTMLRKTLGDKNSVLRTGDFYRLNPPEGSWIDIVSFEQLCRRGMTLSRKGQREEALTIYSTAERLYSGDLFQDVPIEYLEDDQEDWCLQRRFWLWGMALKLQCYMSMHLREQGNLRDALDHCLKALSMDPASDEANMEAMRVFSDQGRSDAVARQFDQYQKATRLLDAADSGNKVLTLFRSLTMT